MKKLLLLTLLLAALFLGAVSAQAEEEARNINNQVTIQGNGYTDFTFLTDEDMLGVWSGWNASLTLESPEGMGGLYIMFDYTYNTYTVSDPDTGTSAQVKQPYLHQYLDLTALLGYAPKKVYITFDSGRVMLCELDVFSTGSVPAYVQQWQPPLDGQADLLLFSTHGDDEHLYFAGLLPLYAGQKHLNVQVVYMTDHRDTTYYRTHEMLDGLWAVGVRAYPVFGWFADFINYDMQRTYEIYEEEYDTTWATLESFVVEQLRRFKPLVAVGHDIYGEYGHGMHKVYTDLLITAVSISGNRYSFPRSADKWGTWEVPKLYLHSYWCNTMKMDYDQPLSEFDGMTAFEVSQRLGFPCHKTQQVERFTTWLYGQEGEITRCDQIQLYNPANFGLYYTNVGYDEEKNDLMEHVLPRAYALRKAEAELALLALTPPPEEPVEEPVPETTQPETPSAPPAVPVPVTTPPSRPNWLPILRAVVLGAGGVTLITLGIVRICRRKKRQK